MSAHIFILISRILQEFITFIDNATLIPKSKRCVIPIDDIFYSRRTEMMTIASFPANVDRQSVVQPEIIIFDIRSIHGILFLTATLSITKGKQMTEKLDPKELVRIQEVLMANSIMIETLAQLLMEKGIISNEEFFAQLTKVKTDYQGKT